MALNGLAMRYYTEPGFRLGAFTHPDPAVRRAAIDLTKRGIDACAAMGGQLMTLWMGQDGFDYAFQADYGRMWDDTVAAIAEVADHNPAIDIAIEYKPNEPRAYALMPDMATTLLAMEEVGRANTGVTLDFCACALRGRDAGAGGACWPRGIQPHPGRASERWLRQAGRRADGGVGASGADGGAVRGAGRAWAMTG